MNLKYTYFFLASIYCKVSFDIKIYDSDWVQQIFDKYLNVLIRVHKRIWTLLRRMNIFIALRESYLHTLFLGNKASLLFESSKD